MEDRPDGPPAGGGLVGIADLAEDLVLAGHQALQAGRDAEEMADRRLVVVHDQCPATLSTGISWNRARKEDSSSTSGGADSAAA